MKKLLVLMLAALMVFMFVSCSEEEASDEEQTPTAQTPANTTTPATKTPTTTTEPEADGEKPVSPANTIYNTLLELYKAGDSSTATIDGIAQTIKTSSVIPFSVFDTSVEPGTLDGFNAEITGFESAICIKPQVANPFIVYLFSFPTVTEEEEVTAQNEEISQFVETLKASANLNWMEIGAADEVVCNSIGNTVFFCMARQAFAV